METSPAYTSLSAEITAKRLELLHEVLPTATSVALLVNPTGAAAAETAIKDAQAAAHKLGLQLHVLHASTEHEFDKAFETMARLRAGALLIGADALFNSGSKQLADLAARHAIPAIYSWRISSQPAA